METDYKLKIEIQKYGNFCKIQIFSMLKNYFFFSLKLLIL